MTEREGVRHISDLEAQRIYRLIRDLSDPDPCWFDHNGGCQAHGYLSLQPGDLCPQQEAKEWLGVNLSLDHPRL